MKWKNGFYVDGEEPEGAIDISEELYVSLLEGQAQGLTIEEGADGAPHLVDYRPSEEEQQINLLRERRAAECFPVINRGVLWYNRLTAEQKAELDTWYQAWLDAPQTGKIPERPGWLKEA